ncbi:aminoglycoside adenylyltransferase domain-containing protein [Paenibacillus allorhizosphaerae]|uniref:Spectinomycin 9-adenylyltransferase n=1 Tax=Paenibacillus allorhizosphaerae TaxID=2849866 RepID=A0ABM8VIM1_9BACL|nr:aminoglycoside adenylyltransferase domain-containing protein [Paenibacillus allorhizosphaerae]CAG7644352.1 Streptomycin 3''-adenylyltransferase [Paenibacillus allorhizosphaerae]
MNISHALDHIAATFKEALKGNVLGIYVHGSLAMGCFNPGKSDIDLLVVVKEKLSPQTMRQITKMTLKLEEQLPAARGLEFSIILEKQLEPFVYPTPFEYHYSEYHREKYRADENYICGGFEDADLASHLVVAYERGLTLYGQPLSELYGPIDKRVYAASILHDVEGFVQSILHDPPSYVEPVYIALNLCRVLYFMKKEVVSSKREGGEWGLSELSERFKPIIKSCLDEYNGQKDHCVVTRHDLLDFVDYMMQEIRQNKKF